MTYPYFSRDSISSEDQPISPLRGMRMFFWTYWAMAAPSPGNKDPPYRIYSKKMMRRGKDKDEKRRK
jgi:hypothetical protein